MEFDKVIHEPVRLRIMMILSGVEQADFNFLLTTLSLTRGNLSRHMEKLELAGKLKTEALAISTVLESMITALPISPVASLARGTSLIALLVP